MRQGSGFSLVELLVATAIAGVLAALAVPAYRSHSLATQRGTARTALVDLAVWQEGHFAQHGRYAASLDAAGPTDAQGCVRMSRESLYRICLAGSGEGFVLEAQPVNGQARDTACGTISLDNHGARGVSGPAGARCWR